MILLPAGGAILIGAAIVFLLWPMPLRASMRLLAAASMGIGAGIGVCSSLYFLWLAALGPRAGALAVVEAAILAAVSAAAFLKLRRHGEIEASTARDAAPGWLTAALIAVAAAGTLIFILQVLRNPHGGWDAFSIWNLRARFLERGGDFWRDAFSVKIPWTHPDYPLLLPGMVAMSAALSGAESTLGPIGIAFLFLAATAGVLMGTLAVARGRTQALLAGILLLGTPAFLLLAAYQYADVPLSFYIAATLGALCLQDEDRGAAGLGAIAGAMAGFAAWTKNEGVLFVAVVVVARALSLVRFEGVKAATRRMAAFGAGLLPPLAVLAIFKIGFAAPNDLTAAQAGNSLLSNLLDAGRYVTVLSAFVRQAIALGGFMAPILLVLAAYLYLVRPAVEEKHRVTAWTLVLTVGLMLAGDFGVYQLLSYALEFQLRTSLDRILLQVWPAGILTFFFLAGTPQLRAPVEEKRAAMKRERKVSRKTAETR